MDAVTGRLHQVGRSHDDLDAAEHFYGEVLGLRRIARYDPPGLLFFDLGDTRLLIERGDPQRNSVLYLWVADIDAAFAELSSRGVAFEGPAHLIFADGDGTFGAPDEEEWMAFFEDHERSVLALATRRPGD